MQVVVPMSGFGERFRRAGYTVPKPLIHVEGKPIISHVVDLFDADSKFFFIVNADHLNDEALGMAKLLKQIAPGCTIVPIAPHRLGPVYACLEVIPHLEPNQEVFVNYADFSCLWDFEDFLKDARHRGLHASVPAYRGFHPHSGGSTNYAYIQEENLYLSKIREKEPFTSDKTREFASSGGYYFLSADLMEHYFGRLLEHGPSVNGEFYVSSAVELMARDDLRVGVYEVRHFMQWGTPEDLNEYAYWSQIFRALASWRRSDIAIESAGPSLILASGRGERFRSVGYQTPKPALSIGGKKLLEQVCLAIAEPRFSKVSLPKGFAGLFQRIDPEFVVEFPSVTEGQAASAMQLLEQSGIPDDSVFSVLPSDTLFADSAKGVTNLIEDLGDRPFIIPWVSAASPLAEANPDSYGWLVESEDGLESYVKCRPPSRRAKVMLGAFTFSSRQDFGILFEKLLEEDTRVNGEYYLDSLVSLAKDLGFEVRLFEPTFSVSLGTPYEFETYRYWQCAFDLWPSHPYSLDVDPFVLQGDVEKLRSQLGATRHLPSEWVTEGNQGL